MKQILDLVVGSQYLVSFNYPEIDPAKALTAAVFAVYSTTNPTTPIFSSAITTTASAEGHITENGATFYVGRGTFIVSAVKTALLEAKKQYLYTLQATLGSDPPAILEKGVLLPLTSKADFAEAFHSSAGGAVKNLNDRYVRLIDNYLDSLLGTFRELRVWDEHVRRDANDPKRLISTWPQWNHRHRPEIFDGQNQAVPFYKLKFDYEKGTFSVDGDSGHSDYFATYRFNYFPAKLLQAYIDLTLQELNVSSIQGRRVVYEAVDQTPEWYDAPLVFGALAKAYKKLQLDSALWVNSLIWKDIGSGSSVAGDMAAYYSGKLDVAMESLNLDNSIGRASSAFELFRYVGFAPYGSASSSSPSRAVWGYRGGFGV